MNQPAESQSSSLSEDSDKSWKRIVWALSIAQALMMMGFTGADTFLPLFIEQLGVHDMRQVNVWAGVIFSSNFLLSAIVSPIWGAMADRKGRKLMVLRSTIAVAIFTSLMSVTFSVWQLLAVRMLSGLFSGFSGAAIALMATKIPEERLGYSLGWMASAGMVGTLVGPLAGGVFVDATQNYRMAFIFTACFALLAFAITALFIEKDTITPGPVKKKPTLLQQLRSLRELKALWTMVPLLFLAQFAVMSIRPILPIYVKELTGNAAFLGTVAGFASSATGIAGLIASPILGKRADKFGYRRMLTICMAGTALFFLPQALAPNIWVLIASRFGLGLFIGGIIPTANALVAHMTPANERGRVFGLTASAMFLGSFAGPLFGGVISAAFGIRIMLASIGVIYLLNLIWLRIFVQEPSHEADNSHPVTNDTAGG